MERRCVECQYLVGSGRGGLRSGDVVGEESKHAITSGADLRLTLRGVVERIPQGFAAYDASVTMLLDFLVSPDKAELRTKCPDAVLRARTTLLKIGSSEDIKAADRELQRERLALDREKLERGDGEDDDADDNECQPAAHDPGCPSLAGGRCGCAT